jgi:hypothetical protein
MRTCRVRSRCSVATSTAYRGSGGAADDSVAPVPGLPPAPPACVPASVTASSCMNGLGPGMWVAECHSPDSATTSNCSTALKVSSSWCPSSACSSSACPPATPAPGVAPGAAGVRGAAAPTAPAALDAAVAALSASVLMAPAAPSATVMATLPTLAPPSFTVAVTDASTRVTRPRAVAALRAFSVRRYSPSPSRTRLASASVPVTSTTFQRSCSSFTAIVTASGVEPHSSAVGMAASKSISPSPCALPASPVRRSAILNSSGPTSWFTSTMDTMAVWKARPHPGNDMATSDARPSDTPA